MDNEQVKYAVFLVTNGFAHKTFWKETTGTVINGHPTFGCSEIDLSGPIARLRVVFQQPLQGTEIRAATIWIRQEEIVALLEVDSDDDFGFVYD